MDPDDRGNGRSSERSEDIRRDEDAAAPPAKKARLVGKRSGAHRFAGILPEVAQIEDEIISLRRCFHAHPELGLEEHWTHAKVKEVFESFLPQKRASVHIETRWNIGGGTGAIVKATFGDVQDGEGEPRVLFRADMDGLPVEEDTSDGRQYGSTQPQKMHACGHDGHMAMLLGAMKVLLTTDVAEKLRGTIDFCFQPAEEGLGGAKKMIADGVLDGVDAVYGCHLWNWHRVGDVGVGAGPIMAASDRFEVDVIGKGGHASMPHGTVDSIVTASNLIVSMQTIVSVTPIQEMRAYAE